MGVAIDAQVMAYAFPKKDEPRKSEQPLAIDRIEPKNKEHLKMMAIVRAVLEKGKTKRIKEFQSIGQMGWRMLGLPPGTQFWQITLVDNTTTPQRSYTALVPEDISRADAPLDRMVLVALRGVEAGSFSTWIVEFIKPLD
ncbi:MAG TPA: hypothetical protein VF815_22495 [Myxococcaceae bacterium]|jgi:hypothetical protein